VEEVDQCRERKGAGVIGSDIFTTPGPGPLQGQKIPWRSFLLALGLTLAGLLFLVLGLRIASNRLLDSFPYVLLGSLCFIPGFYHLVIFIQIFRGQPGYTYDLVPEAYAD